MTRLIEEHFPDTVEYVTREPSLYGDYRNALTEEPRLYEDLVDYEAAKALFEEVNTQRSVQGCKNIILPLPWRFTNFKKPVRTPYYFINCASSEQRVFLQCTL